MVTRRRRVTVAVAVAIVMALGSVATAEPVAAAACPTVFPTSFTRALAARYPGVQITAAVHDTRTGCWAHINQGMQITTASVIKIQVLAAVLLRAQDEGRGLTSWERARITPMIRYSDNPSTSDLYVDVGGPGGMAATDRRLGANATSHDWHYGITSSTAVDRTRVALSVLHGGGDLGEARRREAWSYMAAVHPTQQWGITAGVPDGWTVALKNGFYPATGLGWRVGSSGFVRDERAGQGYAITVMTSGNPDQSSGIRAVEDVARQAAASLTIGAAAPRPVDRARCVRTAAGETWGAVATRLGLPAGRAAEVRLTAGNNSAPLAGQRACAPEVAPEPLSSGSTVNGRYRPVATDLDCDGRTDLLWYGPGGALDTLWLGRADRRFTSTAVNVSGDYVPLAGDFDGDGCGDVFWYGLGSIPDYVWYGGPSVEGFSQSVGGTAYHPVVGDVDGDGRDDILWYLPGGASDPIWYGGPRATFSRATRAVSGSYLPVAGDLDGDGADDLLWYAPGSGADHLWWGTPGQRTVRSTPVSVSGRYRTVSADLDADGADEVLWHAHGTASDWRWDGAPPAPSTPIGVTGSYLAFGGDFDGDGAGDVVWYGPGGRPDSVWWGRAGTTATTAGPLRRA